MDDVALYPRWFVCNAPPLYIQPHSLFITVITMDAQSTTSTQPQAATQMS